MLNLRCLEDIQNLIKGKIEESFTLEYKSKLDNKEIARSICALANSQGGNIVYGVKEQDRIPIAIEWIEGTGIEEKIQNIARTSIQPPPYDVQVKRIENPADSSEAVYVVNVPASPETPHMTDHRYYQRRGSESIPMENDEVKSSMFARGQREALYSEIQCNTSLALQTLSFIQRIYDIPKEARKDIAFIPFHTDAWRSIVNSGLTFTIEETIREKLFKIYRLIHEVNSLFDRAGAALVFHTPADDSSWSSDGKDLPRIIREKVSLLFNWLREVEQLVRKQKQSFYP